MKIFISADMEGITSTNLWEECHLNERYYSTYSEQMTKEVVAACEGAIAAGVDEIIVKDAHNTGTNINIDELPERVKLIRNWNGHPYAMAQGIDSSFDAAMFVGYHSAAGKGGNPLSHTMTKRPLYIKINGQYASEFMLYSYAAAYEGVPTVFLSGDKMLCEESIKLHPKLVTVPVKDGLGASTTCLSTKKSLKLIRENTEKALLQDFKKSKITLPKHFDVEILYKEHVVANKMSFFPGVIKINDNTVKFETDDYFELLRTVFFIL